MGIFGGSIGRVIAERRKWTRPVAYVTAACMLAMLFAPVREAGQAVAAVVQDPMSLFASRSPGERPAGTLVQTKPTKKPLAIVAANLPEERVLSVVRERPAETPDVAAPEVVAQIFDSGVAAPTGLIEAIDAYVPLQPPPVVFAAAPPTPTSAVPEPATWISMIVGLAFIGSAMRRRAASSSAAQRTVGADAGATDAG
jgi:hypothetical protein